MPVVFNVTLPIMVAGSINALWLAVLVNFISTVAYRLNEVARELEDPFKPTHVNDIDAAAAGDVQPRIRRGAGSGALLRRAERWTTKASWTRNKSGGRFRSIGSDIVT